MIHLVGFIFMVFSVYIFMWGCKLTGPNVGSEQNENDQLLYCKLWHYSGHLMSESVVPLSHQPELVMFFFLPDPAIKMAVRQRIFNSTAPFSGSPKAELKGSYPSSSAPDQETEEEEEEGKDSKMGYAHLLSTSPLINKLLTHGTAEQVGKMPLKTSTFIAQAECKYVF